MEIDHYNIWKNHIISKLNGNDVYLSVLENLKDTEFPVIFDINHLCDYLELKIVIIYHILFFSEAFYREFKIPKRRGGYRVIMTPYPSLKYIQRWINDNILVKLETHTASMAFSQGKSIVNNAYPHLGKKYILKLDIKDFFPSIKFKHIYPIFKNIGYSKRVAYSLSLLCLNKEVLPQGAPTSPRLSNLVLLNLDKRLSSLAKKFSYVYTRYADDLTFSGDNIVWKFAEYVIEIIKSEGFEVNKSKTKLISSKKKIITGISISNNYMTIPRKTKREYRAIAFNILRLTPHGYLNTYFLEDPVYIERVIGKMNFWHMIEPNNDYVKETILKLKEYNKKLLDQMSSFK